MKQFSSAFLMIAAGLVCMAVPSTVVRAANLSDFTEFTGEASGDHTGQALATGDVNGDGYEDILISAPENDDGGIGYGAVYLIYGEGDNLADASLDNAITLTGITSGTADAMTLGDYNHDGFDDIAIGVAAYNNAGVVHILYGQAEALTSTSLSGSIRLVGEQNDDVGEALATGDINDDGFDDLIIAASGYLSDSNPGGKVYLLYGESDHWQSQYLTDDIQFVGEEGSETAEDVVVGDVNNDGYDDIIVSAYTRDDGAYQAGSVFILTVKDLVQWDDTINPYATHNVSLSLQR